jgi:dephospho-CoA kinase
MAIADRNVVLIGMMGSGKSTCGRLLAERLGWGFWDNDEALQEATGMTAAELQRLRGQAALHVIEHRLLRAGLEARMSAARLPAYERLADVTVDVASDPRVTCDRVMAALTARAD